MSTSDFAAGQTVPVFIPTSVYREWDTYGIDASLRGALEVEYDTLPGYEFEWGHIIEQLTATSVLDDSGELQVPAITWNFVLPDLHNEFLDAGGHLGELVDLASHVLHSCKEEALAELTL